MSGVRALRSDDSPAVRTPTIAARHPASSIS
jgi:hypothetical protein